MSAGDPDLRQFAGGPSVDPDRGSSASMNLALADAANNCQRQGALATITLRSGVQLTGKLRSQGAADMGTRHMEQGDGWCTFDVAEVAAVSSHR